MKLNQKKKIFTFSSFFSKSINTIKVYFILTLLSFSLVMLSAQNNKNESSDSEGEGIALRNLAQIQGVRINQLLGYGLVVGLSGTGDSRSKFASQSIQNLLGGLGQKIDGNKISETRNIAAVLVTADVPIFAKAGSRISALVSSMGDARSLEGGILIQTPLYGGNQQIFAVAQGALTTGGKNTNTNGGKSGKTVANLLQGVIIERELKNELFGNSENNRKVRIALNNFDFSTLNTLQKKLNEVFPQIKIQIDGASLLMDIPKEQDPINFVAQIENIKIKPNYKARVVINERSGTIVMGGDVHIDPVALSRSGSELKASPLTRTSTNQSTGNGIKLSSGGGNLTENTNKGISKEFSGGNVSELIQALNSMGADVRDIIAILEALKDSGALHAELIVN